MKIEKEPTFVREGYSVYRRPTGWRVDLHSRWEGGWSGRRILIPFSTRFPAEMDMDGQWNECTRNGESLAQYAYDGGSEVGRVLRRGWRVR